MQLEFVVIAGALDGGIASGPGEGDLHGLIEQLETLDLFDGLKGGLGLFKYNEGLALGLQVRLGDDIDDVSILGEDGSQSGLQSFGLDALLEIPHVDAIQVSHDTGTLVSSRTQTGKFPISDGKNRNNMAQGMNEPGKRESMCRSAMTHTW